MNCLNDKLDKLAKNIEYSNPVKIIIFGLGSVGHYLSDYLLSQSIAEVELHICGRSIDKIKSDINILKIANIIRDGRRHTVKYHKVDLDKIDEIENVIRQVIPDFIVNTSRAYSDLKYGSISWKSVRAYGLWAPLAIKYIRNIMLGYENSGSSAIVINTSYSDAVNPWLKSAGYAYPDFGSGNLNHLIPRIKVAAGEICGIFDYENIDITLATSHFHDVVISKEGHVEGIYPLINISYKGENLNVSEDLLYRSCAIPMPIDSKRNMMNASSNFEIITKIVRSIVNKGSEKIHSPGALGYIGGYPLIVDFSNKLSKERRIYFDESSFKTSEMISHNKLSIALDGIEDIDNGSLTFTDKLIGDVWNSFQYELPKVIHFNQIELISESIIENIIKPNAAN